MIRTDLGGNLYEVKKGTIVESGTSANLDITTDAEFADMFKTIGEARWVKISVSTAGTLYVRFNKNTNDVIEVTSVTDLQLNLNVSKIFVSTNGASITFTILATEGRQG